MLETGHRASAGSKGGDDSTARVLGVVHREPSVSPELLLLQLPSAPPAPGGQNSKEKQEVEVDSHSGREQRLQEGNGQRAEEQGHEESTEFPQVTEGGAPCGYGAVGEDREVVSLPLAPVSQILLLPFLRPRASVLPSQPMQGL